MAAKKKATGKTKASAKKKTRRQQPARSDQEGARAKKGVNSQEANPQKLPNARALDDGENEEDLTLGMFLDDGSLGDSRARPEDIAEMGWRERREFLHRRKNRLVFAVAKMMAVGEFERGKTAQRIAAEEQMSLTALQNICAEASRFVELSTTAGRPELVRMARVRLAEIAGQDGKDRVTALKTLLEHLGEMRQKIKLSRDEDFFAGWDERDLESYAATGKLPEGSEEG